MVKGTLRALRFGKGWKAGAPRVRETEIEVPGSRGPFPATLLIPPSGSRPRPGWVALHGITRPGRYHPTLARFVRALASSGAVVLVPEIPEWREMLLAPREAADTLRSAVLALARREDVAPGRLGIMGFSFGGPQALMAGLDPALAPLLGAVASFGGYCEMEHAVRFLFTGEHEWEGRVYRSEPDPYGRWVVGGNYLPRAEGFQDAGDVAEGLLSLARAAGDLQVASWDPLHDTRKSEIEATLHPSRRRLFQAFAPKAGETMPDPLVDELVPVLTEAARRDSPLFDIGHRLAELRVPVRLIHGREDRLIPFTETLRLAACFPPEADLEVFLTGLFSHSQRDSRGLGIRHLREQLRFLRLMASVLGTL